MKKLFVKFNSSGARVLINPKNESELLSDPNVLFNPDLTQVAGLSPSDWRRSGNEVVPKLSMRIKKSVYPKFQNTATEKLKKIIYLTNGFWILLTITLCYILNK